MHSCACGPVYGEAGAMPASRILHLAVSGRKERLVFDPVTLRVARRTPGGSMTQIFDRPRFATLRASFRTTIVAPSTRPVSPSRRSGRPEPRLARPQRSHLRSDDATQILLNERTPPWVSEESQTIHLITWMNPTHKTMRTTAAHSSETSRSLALVTLRSTIVESLPAGSEVGENSTGNAHCRNPYCEDQTEKCGYRSSGWRRIVAGSWNLRTCQRLPSSPLIASGPSTSGQRGKGRPTVGTSQRAATPDRRTLCGNLVVARRGRKPPRRAEARALYDEGLTMDEIATLFGVTRQRVSGLLRKEARAAPDNAAHVRGVRGHVAR